MFRDNLSFISDTTIAATRTQGVRLKDKFKANLIIVLPAAMLPVILLMFIPLKSSVQLEPETYNIWLIMPYLLIIACALIGLNVIAVLGVGITSAGIIGGQLLTAATLAGISPLELSPYCWYPVLILVFGILAIALGLPKFKQDALDDLGRPVLKTKLT
jgi:Na+/H+ antiporter NhaC